MFQIVGSMAEFEQAFRVRAGLRHARAYGKRLNVVPESL